MNVTTQTWISVLLFSGLFLCLGGLAGCNSDCECDEECGSAEASEAEEAVELGAVGPGASGVVVGTGGFGRAVGVYMATGDDSEYREFKSRTVESNRESRSSVTEKETVISNKTVITEESTNSIVSKEKQLELRGVAGEKNLEVKEAAASTADSDNGDSDDGDSDADHGGKTLVCHVPPGNPANEHNIRVGDPAVNAHLKHGDYLGECDGRGAKRAKRGKGKAKRGKGKPGKGKRGKGKRGRGKGKKR